MKYGAEEYTMSLLLHAKLDRDQSWSGYILYKLQISKCDQNCSFSTAFCPIRASVKTIKIQFLTQI